MKEPRFLISWLPRAISKELLYTNPGIGVGSEGLHVTTPSRDLLTGHAASLCLSSRMDSWLPLTL